MAPENNDLLCCKVNWSALLGWLLLLFTGPPAMKTACGWGLEVAATGAVAACFGGVGWAAMKTGRITGEDETVDEAAGFCAT